MNIVDADAPGSDRLAVGGKDARRLGADFYCKPAEVMAPALLGKILCRRQDNDVLRFRITETEAYVGEDDTACHAHRGMTPRNSIMYEAGGHAYIYLCYGIHNLLNVVASEPGRPEAVLLRGVDGFPGPGRLTRAMNIDLSLNKVDLITSNELWIEDDSVRTRYTSSPRIGINYASEEDRSRLWRFTAI